MKHPGRNVIIQIGMQTEPWQIRNKINIHFQQVLEQPATLKLKSEY